MKPINNRPKLIIWDWNGTLLNDLSICIDSMNILLNQRKLKPLDTERYRNIFTFPVKDYYAALGFDFNKEPFEIPALQFMDEYHLRLSQAPLFTEVRHVLETFSHNNIRQIVLSAMEQNSLINCIHSLQIGSYFETIAGISDSYAYGKIERATELLQNFHITPEKAVLIGDTLHDAEVAETIGCPCLLVAQGHQSAEVLSKSSCLVFNNLEEVKVFILNLYFQ